MAGAEASGDKGIAWPRLGEFKHVSLELDETGRTATLTVAGPSEAPPADFEAAGADAWPLVEQAAGASGEPGRGEPEPATE